MFKNPNIRTKLVFGSTDSVDHTLFNWLLASPGLYVPRRDIGSLLIM